MLPSSHKWLRGKKAIKIEECAKDISTADECPLQKDEKQRGGGQGWGGIRICHRPWKKNKNTKLHLSADKRS